MCDQVLSSSSGPGFAESLLWVPWRLPLPWTSVECHYSPEVWGVEEVRGRLSSSDLLLSFHPG